MRLCRVVPHLQQRERQVAALRRDILAWKPLRRVERSMTPTDELLSLRTNVAALIDDFSEADLSRRPSLLLRIKGQQDRISGLLHRHPRLRMAASELSWVDAWSAP